MANRWENGVVAPQTAVLYQVVKVLFGISKRRVGGFDDERGGTLKWFLGRNSLQPALSGEFFVVGKVETHEKLYGFGGCGRVWFGLVFALALGLVRLFGFTRLGAVFRGSSGGDAFKFEEEFLVEAVSLLPTLKLVARLLSLFFVFCEVKLNISVGHEISLRLAGGVSQEMAVDCGGLGSDPLNVENRRVLLDNSFTFGGTHHNNPREIYVQMRYRFHY